MTDHLYQELPRAQRRRLLMKTPYREPDVYQVSSHVSGAVSQVQKTAMKAVRKLEVLHRVYSPRGEFRFEISTVKPRQVVIVGSLSDLFDGAEVNPEKHSCFELFRRGHQDVEILTFDELYARARYIVESQGSDL